ncbi:MAG: BMC domain-containing protein [Candidatus Handelsmanbacteria bacterium]|nr:BMC domain-containing protein [Candidatus Handelsmanbacteria bacterium]
MARAAIGLIETEGLVGLIEAADVAAKTADVQLSGFERIGGGLVSLRLSGDVASVQTAIRAAAEAAQRLGQVISYHVIPGPHEDLVALVEGNSPPPSPVAAISPAAATTLSLAELESLPVARLRQRARQYPDFSLKGRAISRAGKAELLAAFEQLNAK